MKEREQDTRRQRIDPSVRSSPGGYRSYHFWHSGYHEHRIRDADDYNAQLVYIANNPARKHYEDYPHVHTGYLDRIDPIPSHLHP